MSIHSLFPHRFKLIGWCLFFPSLILGFIVTTTGYEVKWLHATVFAIFSDVNLGELKTFSFIRTDLTNTLLGVLFIAGAMIVILSREKKEDEFIAKIRLSSLLWALVVSYSLLFLSFVFVYGTAFLTIMVYNMFTVLIIFIARFNYLMYRSSKIVSP